MKKNVPMEIILAPERITNKNKDGVIVSEVWSAPFAWKKDPHNDRDSLYYVKWMPLDDRYTVEIVNKRSGAREMFKIRRDIAHKDSPENILRYAVEGFVDSKNVKVIVDRD